MICAYNQRSRARSAFTDERTTSVAATVQQLAALVKGTVEGDASAVIAAARPLGEAQPGDISFVENDKHSREFVNCRASALVVPANLAISGRTVIRVADALGAFVDIVRRLHGLPEEPVHGIDPQASVHPTATLGAGVSVYPFACIGAGSTLGAGCRIHANVAIGRFCKLGDDVTIYPGAVLYDGTVLGNRVIVHANAVLGADGFGYRLLDGRHSKVPQLGRVEIGDDVEVGACTTIDRGTFQATQIGTGTKLDNLVMVGHNCRIGKHNLFVSQVGMAGSSSTGDYVVLAGQVGVVDHVHIGDRTIIGAQSGVPGDVPADQQVLGAPARPIREQKRILISLDKLPEMVRDLRRIKQKLGLADEAPPKKAAG
jgi:UDP-3-O-[3-hydroxymyristoyl] glucosamine N-acyltransferase